MLTLLSLPLPVVLALLFGHWSDGVKSNPDPLPSPRALSGQAIKSFSIIPAALPGGTSSSARVSLRLPAKAGGVEIKIESSDVSDVMVPKRVMVSEGQSSVEFSIATKPVKSMANVSVSVAAEDEPTTSTFVVLPQTRKHWYVTQFGTRHGHGTKASPWDLATALAGGPNNEVVAGDVIWVAGGNYKGNYVSTIRGTTAAPIIVRAQPAERAVIDKGFVDDEKRPALAVRGAHVWFWGLEITNSNPNRSEASPYTGEDRPWRGSGADVYAPNVKFINMVFHDNGQGIWDKQNMTEFHGCLFFYNGNNKREHALYVGNSSGTKYITDNIIFDQAGYGILAHSDTRSSSQKGLHIEGNVAFNNGSLTPDNRRTANLQIGGIAGVAAERIVIKNNFIYNSPSNAKNKSFGIRLGYEDKSNRDVRLLDNYIVSRFPMTIWWWNDVEVLGNTIYSDGQTIELSMPAGVSVSSYRWDFNSYLGPPVFSLDSGKVDFRRWRETTGADRNSLERTASGVDVFVRSNRYEAGRAHVVVFNWAGQSQVAVDLSSVLKPGSNYEIRDAQNYFGGPVVAGSFNGGNVMLPLNLSAVAKPVGQVEKLPIHTSGFSVFVVTTTNSKSSPDAGRH